MDTRIRSSSEQFAILIQFMEENGDIAKPQPGLQGRIKADRLWEELSKLLNSSGEGPSRRTEKWKKVWADWKAKTKKKAHVLTKKVKSAGDGPKVCKNLTHLEQRVLSVMGLNAVVGLPNIEEGDSNISPSEHLIEDIIIIGTEGTSLLEEEFEQKPPLAPSVAPSPSIDTSNTRRRRVPWTRRRMTPFQSARRIEQLRLDMEEARDKRKHERELKWLEVVAKFEHNFNEREKEKIALEAEKVKIFKEICVHIRNLTR